ncbi:YolD-like family protein [Heyndrickxia ginsengihumi]|uniref:YolD-like family protein n=1 Tax=Heyndrickxia ginsengihumi TaxID=363870 RepID=UPI0004714894|nr:YolD-like family protein [Heyndrickxia ginsengihumi]MBE6185533.1 YolD-like family protein [Bacillus sp. (in: firmicutes)]MCM3023547.1 YolD-like family protein [Heyndrickxia ginsengihumi]
MIRDRGNKKWVSLMLPEHVQMLKEMAIDLNRQEQPILDEDQIQELEIRINDSIQHHLPLEFTIIKEGFEQRVTGYVHRINQIQKQFKLKDMNDNVKYINFSEIVDVNIID